MKTLRHSNQRRNNHTSASRASHLRTWITMSRVNIRLNALSKPPSVRFVAYMQKTVSFFGPCAPRTRMRSMSPVRLGPVIRHIMLG